MHPTPLSRIFIVACFILISVRSEARNWPDWLNEAASLPTPAFATNAPAVVLLEETSLEIDSKGIAIEVHRSAVRILHLSGRTFASGNVVYNGSADRVLEINAWLIRNGKLSRPIRGGDWVDFASNLPGAAIDEYRSKGINLSNEAVPGDVFGIETHTRRPLILAQLHWRFGSPLPQLTERLSLRLPTGFSLEEKLSGQNPPTLETATSAREKTWTWTVTNRPFRPQETWSDPLSRSDASLLINLSAPPKAASTFPQSFRRWSDVTRFYESLNQGQCDTSVALAAKADALTAGHSDQLGKIQALGQFVQKIRYVAINQGLRYGYGWKARTASSVFSNGYGDCKDKVNLLMAMLRESGIRSHLVIARVDRDYGLVAHDDFPSPLQFNHAIIGIEVSDDLNLPAVMATENLGRILFFDPTDPYTLVGDLPASLQGTNVHLANATTTALISLPRFSAKDAFLIERKIQLSFSPDGQVIAEGEISATGQTGALLRQEFESLNQPKDFERFITEQLSDGFRGAVIAKKQKADDPLTGRATLSFTCEHPRFLQRLQGNAAMVKLDVLSRHYLPNFSANERILPIELRPLMIRDQIVLKLAEGYTVDKVPTTVALESAYGTYSASFSIEEKSLIMRRTVVLNRLRIPAEDYAKVRRFFSDMVRTDRSSVLLQHGG